jgi:hypothetical protein
MTAARRFALIALIAVTAAAFGQSDYIEVRGTITEFDASQGLRLAQWKGGKEITAYPISRTRYYLLEHTGGVIAMRVVGPKEIEKGMRAKIGYRQTTADLHVVYVLPKKIAKREKNRP